METNSAHSSSGYSECQLRMKRDDKRYDCNVRIPNLPFINNKIQLATKYGLIKHSKPLVVRASKHSKIYFKWT